jgi:hypothetical protein
MFFRRTNRKPIGILMIAGGSVCLLVAAGWSIYSYHLTATALRASGRITEMVKRRGSDGDYWYPVYVFTDRDGVLHTVHSSAGSAPPGHSVGDRVTVLYYAGAGDEAHLDDWSTLWGVPIVCVVIGAIDLPIGLVVLMWPRLVRRKQGGVGGQAAADGFASR